MMFYDTKVILERQFGHCEAGSVAQALLVEVEVEIDDADVVADEGANGPLALKRTGAGVAVQYRSYGDMGGTGFTTYYVQDQFVDALVKQLRSKGSYARDYDLDNFDQRNCPVLWSELNDVQSIESLRMNPSDRELTFVNDALRAAGMLS